VRSGGVSVSGGDCGSGPYSAGCDDYDYDFDFDFLAAVSKKYLLVDEENRIKGDGAYYFSKNDNVKFYDSINGYVGTDESNSEGNAYLRYNMTSSTAYRGPQKIWVTKNSETWCSYKNVILQSPPSLRISIDKSPNYRSEGGIGSTDLVIDANPYVDFFSKAVQENTGYSLKWYYRASTAVDWQLVDSDIDVLTDRFYHAVSYFKVILDDGTYETIEEFHVVTSTPAPGASPCDSKPWLAMCSDL